MTTARAVIDDRSVATALGPEGNQDDWSGSRAAMTDARTSSRIDWIFTILGFTLLAISLAFKA